MQTDRLIDSLAERLEPARGNRVLAVLAPGLGGGALVSTLLMLALYGARGDLALAFTTAAFWMKFAYTLSLAIAGFWIVERLARPGVPASTPMLLAILPLLVIAMLAGNRLMPADADRMALIMGFSAKVCSVSIVFLSLPILVGNLWALRQLAPTRLSLAGAAAGLLAGGTGAWIYGFHCTDMAAPFIAIWYTLGIGATAGIGALLGPRFLRW